VREADNLPPSCAFVTKSGNLNFLEPSGPVQACNGTALHLLLLNSLHGLKGKFHPRRGHEGPEEEQMYNSTLL